MGDLVMLAMAFATVFVCGFQVGKLVELHKNIKELEELQEDLEEIFLRWNDLNDIPFGGDGDDETN